MPHPPEVDDTCCKKFVAFSTVRQGKGKEWALSIALSELKLADMGVNASVSKWSPQHHEVNSHWAAGLTLHNQLVQNAM